MAGCLESGRPPFIFRQMAKRWFLIICLLLIGGCRQQDTLSLEERAWLNEHDGQIILAMEPGYPPFSFFDDDGQFKGLAVDYIKRIEARLGFRFKRVPYDKLSSILNDAQLGRVDVVNAVSRTPERSEYLNFTEPFIKIPSVIIVTRAPGISELNPEEMRDMLIAVGEGYAATEYLKSRYDYLSFDPVPDDREALLKVAMGNADAAIVDLAAASYHIQNEGITNLRLVGSVGFEYQLAIGSRKDLPMLGNIITKGLSTIPQRERDEIYRKWIHLEYKRFYQEELFWVTGGSLAALTVLVLLVIIFWNRALRHAVAQKTEELKCSREKYRELVQNADSIIVRTNSQGEITFFNEYAEKVFGYSQAEILGRNIMNSIVPPQESSGRDLQSIIDELFRHPEKHSHSINENICKDGHLIWVSWHNRVIRNPQGDFEGLLSIGTDISEQKRAQDALRESEQRLRMLGANLPSAMLYQVVMQADGSRKFSYVSDNVRNINQVEAQEVINDPRVLYNQIAPSMLPGLISAEEESRRTMSTFRQEVLFNLPDGQQRWFLLSSTPHEVNQGCVAWDGIQIDITDRKLALLELAESQRMLATLMSNLPGMAYRCRNDNHWTMEFISEGCREVTGYAPSALLNNSQLAYADLIAPDDREMVWNTIQKALSKGRAFTITYRIIRLDGEQRWVWEKGRGVFDADGNLQALEGFISDITKRKLAEDSLRREKDFNESLIQSSPTFFVTINNRGQTMMMNRAMLNALGYSLEEVLQQDYLQTFVPAEDREMLKHVFDAIVTQRQSTVNENRVLAKDGRELLVEWHGQPVFDDRDNFEFFFGVGIDISERKRLQETMIQTEKMMSVGGLAAGMAHEINNPLAGIMQNVQVLQNRLNPELKKNQECAAKCGTHMDMIQCYMESRGLLKMLESLNQTGQRAAQVVNNMLSFSRKSEGQVLPEDLARLVDSTIDLAANDYDLKKHYDFRHIKIQRIYEELPSVPCEASKIQQVILNLLKNGAQAMVGRAKPTFTIRLKAEQNMAVLIVEDNGPGMSDEIRRRIFEPFFTTKEKGVGTGLGLSVSYFIITEDHHGSMEVESAPGRGTRFIVRLPLP